MMCGGPFGTLERRRFPVTWRKPSRHAHPGRGQQPLPAGGREHEHRRTNPLASLVFPVFPEAGRGSSLLPEHGRAASLLIGHGRQTSSAPDDGRAAPFDALRASGGGTDRTGSPARPEDPLHLRFHRHRGAAPARDWSDRGSARDHQLHCGLPELPREPRQRPPSAPRPRAVHRPRSRPPHRPTPPATAPRYLQTPAVPTASSARPLDAALRPASFSAPLAMLHVPRARDPPARARRTTGATSIPATARHTHYTPTRRLSADELTATAAPPHAPSAGPIRRRSAGPSRYGLAAPSRWPDSVWISRRFTAAPGVADR